MSNDPWANQQQPAGGNPFGGGQQQAQQQPGWGPQQSSQQGQQRGPQPPGLNDTLAGGGQSAFNQDTPVGVAIQGTIVSAKVESPRVGDKFWDDGGPRWIIEVHIENAQWSQDGSGMQPLRTSQDDDGKRIFFIKTWGDNFRALQEAIKATGHTEANKALAPGVLFAGKHTGRQRSSKGGNDELLYAYHIGAVAAGPTGAMPQPAAPQQAVQPQPAPVQGQWPQQQAAQQEEPPF